MLDYCSVIQFTNKSYSFGDPNPKLNMSIINNFAFDSYATLL